MEVKKMTNIAVVLIRGLVGVQADVKDTLAFLNIRKKHACVVVKETPTIKGMLHKIENVATFGPISDEVYAQLKEKRGKSSSDENTKEVFFLAPPVGGFERKGIKQPFSVGGALGKRKEGMDLLIKKMM
jgi:large subunit ribosomal protein L30